MSNDSHVERWGWRVNLLWTAAILIAASSLVSTQRDERLAGRFSDAVIAAAPGAKAELIPSVPEDIRIRWQLPDGERLEVRYWIRESGPSAAKFARQLAFSIPVPNRRIDGFGDEAYLLAPVSVRHESLLIFRRGRVVVETRIRGEQNVKNFAALFAKEAARAISAGEVDEG